MKRALPPLNALRAFEAAARHLSLSRAAEELHVTPAAVSHQVKALERSLELKLFRRVSRALVLTDAGQLLLAPLSEGFDRIADGVARVRAHGRARPLAVSVPPSFGAKWLVPRLEKLRAAYPDLDVRIDASMRLVDLDREDMDLAIRYGHGSYPGLLSECLLSEEAFPVCSPKLLAQGPPLAAPADLAAHTLIHTEVSSLYPDWGMWLKAVGAPHLSGRRELQISLASMAVEAAVAGQGVLLVGGVLVADDLAQGRLVRLFDTAVPVSLRYHLVRSPRRTPSRELESFIAWLKREAAT